MIIHQLIVLENHIMPEAFFVLRVSLLMVVEAYLAVFE
jgi:hypothetical protein